ncbi:MAG: ATP-binding cassette, subfamily bacterial [Micromonosporaceae bacterium]
MTRGPATRDPGRLGAATEHAGQLRAAAMLAWRAGPAALLSQLGASVLAGVLPVLTAWATKLILDGLNRRSAGGTVLVLAVLLGVLGVVSAAVNLAGRYAQNQLGRSVTMAADGGLYRALNRFVGLVRFEDPQFQDRLQLAGQSGRGAPGQLVRAGLSLGQGAITMAGFLGTLVAIGPWMAAVVVAAAVPTLRAEFAISRRRADLMWRTGHAMRREIFYAHLLSDVRAAMEVRLFGLGEFFRLRMMRELSAIHDANRRLDRRELLTQGALSTLGALTTGAGLVWAIAAARSGALTVGDVSVFVAAVAGTQAALTTMVRDTAVGYHNLLMFGHYRAVVQAGPDLPVPPAPAAVRPLRHAIELHDVWFRYSAGHPWVLRGVDLAIPCGTAVALVGGNGAGKSTLVKLLCRFYDPTRGSIRWDGLDLRDLAVADLRARIGAVFQDFMTYDLSARENIGVGDLAALDDLDRIAAAADRARVDAVVTALPQGYETLLTRTFTDHTDRTDPTTGVLLSGGQWQRVALARAFLRDRADLLVLDEPSAGLDAEAEYDIHTRLRRHRAGRTTVLISHRLSAVRDADQIVVLRDGVVAEQGNHAELMARAGQYARMFALQARGYRADSPAAGAMAPAGG